MYFRWKAEVEAVREAYNALSDNAKALVKNADILEAAEQELEKRSGRSGTVDIDRYEKYCFYWLQSMQSARNKAYGPMVFIASTYSKTSDLNVNVFSNCDSVRLYQNGTLVDELYRETELEKVPNIASKGGSPIYTFQLDSFVAGELKAEAVLDGEVVSTHVVKTPEHATHFEIEIRTRGIVPVADGSDLIPVYIKAVDENGTVVPDYKGTVSLEVMGEGQLVGEDIPRIKVEEQKLEAGIGFAFVRYIEVSSDGETWTTALESQTVGGQHYKPEAFEKVQTNVNYVRVNIENIVAGGDYQVGMAECERSSDSGRIYIK